MHIAVCLKYVPDPSTIEADPLTGSIDTGRVLYMMNPADESALELALRLRPPNGAVTVLSVGPVEADRLLQEALAAGADAALRVWDDALGSLKPIITTALLAAALRMKELPGLVLCGGHSVDRGSGTVPALLAEHLDWPVATDVTQFVLQSGRIRVQRRLARGARAESEITLPAVLGLETGLAHLRQASLPSLMRVKHTPIPLYGLEDLGLSPQDLHFPAMTLHEIMPPRPRAQAMFTPDASAPVPERIAQIMSAGAAGKAGKVLDSGTPEQQADAIIEFLHQRGFLEHRT
ncbi:MAG TPA: electron transfer flavoprotein subunit beta [Candidatus Competibacteraceae bacterium]|nr:electron transfer flavoprotein subunit beta [Candidatus Competibacteraceae bacterium]MCP5134118.1 electron transfer flavoprotein subunit beta [Gammaproteobacteria bacterium]HPF59939.1 electron transfer flavoprotein subunit beta [Candidatus Competibacteraceae bacterium]HRY19123.1 electron transfer flavoprotein subunit beta [Candidatus Competibacteraceae bacterium]